MLDKIKTFLDKWGRVFLDVAMATVTYIALYKEGIFPKLDMWSLLKLILKVINIKRVALLLQEFFLL